MVTLDEGLSQLLDLFRRHGEHTRADLVARTGLSRTSVGQRLDALVAANLLSGQSADVQTKGRPADRFLFNADRGYVLAADIGVTHSRVGLCNLAGEILHETVLAVDVTTGPEGVMDELMTAFRALETAQDVRATDILGIGVGIPAPVKANAGFTVNPPIMPNWNRFDVPAWFSTRYSVPVVLEKDANIMAYGEARFEFPDIANLMFVKVGTGIGSGFMLGGQLFRGSDGAAGDIGHTLAENVQPDEGPLCKCGNHGCLEAFAGGWAMLRDLKASGEPRYQSADLLELISAGDPRALESVRRSGRLIGSAIASAINLVNPRMVVIGGGVVTAGGDHLFAGIREMVYRRSHPLATAELRIERSRLYPRGGLMGLASLVVDAILSPERIGELLSPQ